MVQITFEDGKFLVTGTFSIGIAGVFEEIEIEDTLEDILDEIENENSYSYQPLFPYLKGKGDRGEDIAKGLEDYYNAKEAEIKKNVKQINDCILFHLFDHLENCEYPFWEIEEAIIPGSLDGYNEDGLYDIYATDEAAYNWAGDFDEKPNNGTLEKVDVEGKLRKMYPMFNFDALYESIVPEGVSFHGRFISFQFSDGWGGALLECAYDRFDENLVSCEWHNH